MKKGIVLFLLMLSCTSVSAQTKHAPPIDSTKDFMIALEIGGSRFFLPNLDRALAASGLPEADKAGLLLGVQIDIGTLTNRSRAFGSIEIGYSDYSQTSQNISSYATTVMTNYSVNYLLIRKSRNFLYPSLGLGFTGFDLSYTNTAQHPASFQNALSNFTGERRLTTDLLFTLLPGINYAWALDKTEDMFIGVNFTYEIGLARGRWKLKDNYALPGSPRSGVNGFTGGVYFSVM